MVRNFSFSQQEILHLLIAWGALSLAFAILFRDDSSFSFFVLLGMVAIGVGGGFILHELAHKFVAQRYGHHAEFRANPLFLLFSIGIAFFGFIFVIPGGVLLSQQVNKATHGRIALVGPLVNLVLAVIFFSLLFVTRSPFFTALFLFGSFINAWLGLLNLLPFSIFDGKAVFGWHKGVYTVSVILALVIFLVVQFFPTT